MVRIAGFGVISCISIHAHEIAAIRLGDGVRKLKKQMDASLAAATT